MSSRISNSEPMSKEEKKVLHSQAITLGIVIVIAMAVAGLGGRLWSVIVPQSIVVTGTSDQNLLEVAGKPTAVLADGLQKVAMVDAAGNGIQAALDPCHANKLENFNTFTNSTMVVNLIPPATQVSVCSIHVHANTGNPEVVNILEGGGMDCSGSPKALDGSLTPAQGLRIPGNGYFVQGGGGATIYKTSGPMRGVCADGGKQPFGGIGYILRPMR